MQNTCIYIGKQNLIRITCCESGQQMNRVNRIFFFLTDNKHAKVTMFTYSWYRILDVAYFWRAGLKAKFKN